MKRRSRPQGFTLIELMIALAILCLLLMLGMPIYSTWITNTRIRNAAESIQNGLRLARVEAVQSGRPARFEMQGTQAGWTVCSPAPTTPGSCAAPRSTKQTFNANDATGNVLVGGTTSRTVALNDDVSTQSITGRGITFDSNGRVLAGTVALAKIDVAAARSDSRRLVTVISAAGSVRLCDPQLSQSEHAQGCMP
ncbi:type IV fimbrial biogenesis protein FimT [Tahibacter aquaticus]|uniref:Type II secretion system protein H n=1 Tax=Tahibacter aquaticus TaxID=520092 RepID=A0A4R6ZA03_9GAMM|nr:GspH/FimT family pseudopilin [Tahibacter aquaticus]TDR48564.1 type IV fimbrial biogenesis protein FimT [Tahibacter aquaticus]